MRFAAYPNWWRWPAVWRRGDGVTSARVGEKPDHADTDAEHDCRAVVARQRAQNVQKSAKTAHFAMMMQRTCDSA
jgi:hypothetical protein